MEPYTHYQKPPPSVNGGKQFTAARDLIAMQGFKLMSNINCNLDFLELHLTSYAYSEADCSIQALFMIKENILFPSLQYVRDNQLQMQYIDAQSAANQLQLRSYMQKHHTLFMLLVNTS